MPTNIDFPLTTPANMTRYLMWHEDAVYGDLDVASPDYTSWFGVSRIHNRTDVDAELFYEAGSGYTWYALVDKARNFTVDIDFSLAQIAELEYMTTLPNFTTPDNTLAKARTYLICRKANNAGTFAESFQLLRHAVPTSLELTLASSAQILGRTTLAPRLISKPAFTNPLTTPVMDALGSISLPIWRAPDAGQNAITINAIPYPITNMTVRVTQGYAFDRVYGSELLDAATLGTLTVNGTFTSKAFKDMVLRGAAEAGALQSASVPAIAKLKSGAGQLNFTKFTIKNLDEMIEFGSNTTQDETFDYEAQAVTVTT